MASTVTLTGRIVLPGDAAPNSAQIRLQLTGTDTDQITREALPAGGQIVIDLDDGDVPADTVIWRNTAGLAGSSYNIYLTYTDADGRGQSRLLADRRTVGDEDSYDLSDLIDAGVAAAAGTYVRAITAAQYNAAIAARDEAQGWAAVSEQAAGQATAAVVALAASSSAGLAATSADDLFAVSVAAAGDDPARLDLYINDAGTARLLLTDYRPNTPLVPTLTPSPAAAAAMAAVLGVDALPIDAVLGRALTMGTGNAAPALAAAIAALPGLRITNPNRVRIRATEPIIVDSGVDLEGLRVIKAYSMSGVGGALFGQSDIATALEGVRFSGVEVRLETGTETGVIVRLRANDAVFEDCDIEHTGGQNFLLSGARGTARRNKTRSLNAEGFVGDGGIRISDVTDWLVEGNICTTNDDSCQLVTPTYPDKVGYNTNSSRVRFTGNRHPGTKGRGAIVSLSSDPQAVNRSSTSLIDDVVIEGQSGNCRSMLFRILADDVAPGLRINNIRLKDLDFAFLPEAPFANAAQIMGWYYGNLGKIVVENANIKGAARAYGLNINAPGGQIRIKNMSVEGGRNALVIDRPDLGEIVLEDTEWSVTGENLLPPSIDPDSDIYEERVDGLDRRGPIIITIKNRKARARISFSSVGAGADGDTIGIGATVYTLRTTVSAPFDVQIGATASDTATNLQRAITAGTGEGTSYGTGTTAHPDFGCWRSGATVGITAKVVGAAYNDIPLTATGSITGAWETSVTIAGHTATGRQLIWMKGTTTLRGISTPTISGTPTPQHAIVSLADNVDLIIDRLDCRKAEGATGNYAISMPSGCTVRVREIVGDIDNLTVTGGAAVLPWSGSLDEGSGSVTDLDSVTANGRYTIPNTGVTGRPTDWGSDGQGTLDVTRGSNMNNVTQVATRLQSNTRWWRVMNGGTWSEWKKVQEVV